MLRRKQKDEDTSSHDYHWRSTGGYVLIRTFDIYLICRQESWYLFIFIDNLKQCMIACWLLDWAKSLKAKIWFFFNFLFYKCYDICFYNFCDKHSLMGKKPLLKSKKNTFQISHLIFLETAGGQISDLWLNFHSFLLLHLIQAQMDHFSFIWNIWLRKKMMDKVEIFVWNILMWRKWETKFWNP